MSPTSIGGGYRFDLQAASISPASLKRSSGKKIFLHRDNLLSKLSPIRKIFFEPMRYNDIYKVPASINGGY